MYPRKAEASCDISKCNKYYFPQVSDPPIINSAKKVHFLAWPKSILASNLVGVNSFQTTLCRLPFVDASKIAWGFSPGLISIP
jgi:hypothetical protein